MEPRRDRQIWTHGNEFAIRAVTEAGADPAEWFDVYQSELLIGRFGSLGSAQSFVLTRPDDRWAR